MEEKDKVQLIITAGLILILLVLGLQLGVKKQKPLIADNKVSGTTPSIKEEDNNQNLYANLEKEMKNMEFSRDPFSFRPAVISQSSNGLYLSGILWDESNPAAIINGTVVTVGSQIVDKRVIAIEKNKVFLKEGDKTIELILE